MTKYLSFLRIRFTNSLQYRAAAIAGLATQFAWGGMTILMFSAFYAESPENFPMSFEMLSSYIWLQQSLLTLFIIWFGDNEIFDSIINGNVAYELCRPVDIYSIWFTRNAAIRLSKVVLRCLPVIVFAFLLPEPYNLSLPVDLKTFLFFLLSALLSFVLSVSIMMLVYVATFYTLSPRGVLTIAAGFTDILSGHIIPLPFFPDALQNILFLLPFGSLQGRAYLIYVGYISGDEIYSSLLIQLFWVVTLVALGRYLMGRALKKVVVQGG